LKVFRILEKLILINDHLKKPCKLIFVQIDVRGFKIKGSRYI